MKLYLLKVLQNNEIKDLANEEMANLVKKHNANIYQLSVFEVQKYLIAFVFEDAKDRDNFADKIQHISFDYEDVDYPDEYYQKSLNEKNLFDKAPKNHRPSEFEIKIDEFFKKNHIEVEKSYKESIYYDFVINNKKGMIVLPYKPNFILCGLEGENMMVTKEKKFVKNCLYDFLKDLEKELKKTIVS